MYKALRNELAAVLAELQRIEAGEGVNEELLDTIELIAVILGELKGESEGANKKETADHVVSVGADTEQPIQKCNSITLKTTKFNIFIEKAALTLKFIFTLPRQTEFYFLY